MSSKTIEPGPHGRTRGKRPASVADGLRAIGVGKMRFPRFGDRSGTGMRSAEWRAHMISRLAATAAFAAPNIFGLYNGATWAPVALPNSGVAQGSIFTITGTGLGPAALQQAFSYLIAPNAPAVASRYAIRVVHLRA